MLNKNIKILKISFCFLICLAVLSASSGSAVLFDLRDFKYSYFTDKSDEAGEFAYNSEKYVFAQTSENTVLYVDPDDATLCVENTSTGRKFYTDPSRDPYRSGISDPQGSDEVTVRYRYGDEIVTVGSRSDRVTVKCDMLDSEEKGVRITYGFPLVNGGVFSLTFRYYLENGTFFALCDEIPYPQDSECDILSVTVLKGLCTDLASSGDYFYVPDGSGAKMSLDPQYDPANVTVKIYGGDPSLGESPEKTSVLPAFGMKIGKDAILAVALSGDAQMSVTACRSGKEQLSSVYPTFELTGVCRKSIEGKTLYIGSDNTYNGEILIAYRFLSDSSSDLDGMAQVCREELYRYGSLLYTQRLEKDAPPLTLCFDGNELNYAEVEKALDGVCKAGVSKINAVYRNSLDGVSAVRGLGGKRMLERLYGFCRDRGINLYLEYKLDSHIPSGCVRDIFGHAESAHLPDSFDRSIDGLYGKYDYLNSLYIDDLGTVLYSAPQNDVPLSRQTVKDSIKNYLRKLSVDRNIAVFTGNIYSVKNAALVLALPDGCFNSAKGYFAVPFVQSVLHGQVDYTLSPITVSGDFGDRVLNAMEYASMPSFNITANYEKEVEDIATCYLSSYKIIEELSDKTLNSNDEVAKDLKCSVFEGDRKLYVNYGKKDIIWEGVKIASKSLILM